MIIALILICFFAALLFCPVCADISHLLYKEENVFTIKVGPVKPFITVFKNSGEKKEKRSKKSTKNNGEEKKNISFEIIKNIILEVGKLFAYFKKHLKIEKFKLHFHIGADDAALTGILSGAAWGALYDILALVDNKFTLKEKNVHIAPDFTEKVFECDICVRLSVKVFYLLIFAAKTHNAIKKLELH